jgi:hypothetical protein
MEIHPQISLQLHSDFFAPLSETKIFFLVPTLPRGIKQENV